MWVKKLKLCEHLQLKNGKQSMKHALFLPCRLASVPLLPVFRLCLRLRGRGKSGKREEATQWFVFLLSSAPLPPSQSEYLSIVR